MAFTEIYVDPSLNSDTGAGTVGDPFGDLEYAIEQTTFDTTNGTRVNIKAGTDEVLAADLRTALADTVTTVAWAPSATAPLIFQGYTTSAGDGGIGGISGGGLVGILLGEAQDDVHFIDLHLHNTGSDAVLDIDDRCSIIRCEINNCASGVRAVGVDNSCIIDSCYIHDVGGNAVYVLGDGTRVENCYLKDGPTQSWVNGIYLALAGATAERNIVICEGSSNGILIGADGCSALNNSVYSSGGTGTGILSAANSQMTAVRNNLVEGFSGAGGVGIDFGATTENVFSYGGNAVYNCTTAYDVVGYIIDNVGDNETLTASPFTDAANGDFSPVDTGNVKEGSLPASVGGGLV